MTFSAKKLKHVKSVFCIAKTVHFIRKNNCSCSWTLLLKLHLATFSDWERSFWAFVASHSHNLLSGTKHRIGVLRSSKMTFSAKKLKHVNICLLHCKNINFMRNNHFLCSWALLLKLHLATFSDWEWAFEHLWPRILIICLVCTKHRIGVLRSSKEVLLCN